MNGLFLVIISALIFVLAYRFYGAFVAAIDTDEGPELAAMMKVEYIPALFVYKDGVYSDMLIAPKCLNEVETWLKGQGAL